MSPKKWDSQEIWDFLDVYEQYESLWKVTHTEYSNKAKREGATYRLLQELRAKGKEMTRDELKNKIRIVRTVYRKEAKKVEASKKTAEDPSEVYQPRLFWFKKADSFLRNTFLTRVPASSLEINDILDDLSDEKITTNKIKVETFFDKNTETLDDRLGDRHKNNADEQMTDEHDNDDIHNGDDDDHMNKTELVYKVEDDVTNVGREFEKQIWNYKSSKTKKKSKKKMQKYNNTESTLDETVATFVDTSDEIDVFMRYIAIQMRKLPKKSALILQQKIQNVVTEELLKNFDSLVDNNTDFSQTAEFVAVPSPTSHEGSLQDDAPYSNEDSA